MLLKRNFHNLILNIINNLKFRFKRFNHYFFLFNVEHKAPEAYISNCFHENNEHFF